MDRFDALISKIIFKKYKNIILIHFSIKNTLKNNYNHTSKHPEPGLLNEWVKQLFFFFFLIKEERVSIIYGEQGGPSSIIITFFFPLLWVIYLEKVAGQNDGCSLDCKGSFSFGQERLMIVMMIVHALFFLFLFLFFVLFLLFTILLWLIS